MVFRCLLGISLLSLCSTVAAQGLRISTQVYDVSDTDSRTAAKIISSSLSLCHNGRIFDYVDAADEVVIFDPVERRFTILHQSRGVSTRLSFDEIRHMLDSRMPRIEEYLKELLASGKPEAAATVKAIQFQLNPKFSQTFDPMKGTLVLSSPSFTYRVETRKWNDSEQVERYLNYADWTAKLNSLLHPGSMFPEPRVVVNKALREQHDRMPISVELDLRPGEPLRLRAEHQLTQKLSDDDHQRIARWEATLTKATVRSISFRSYQETMLGP